MTDACCDANYSQQDYTLPDCQTDSIFVFYNAPGNDRVHIYVYVVYTGGQTLIAESNLEGERCDCAKFCIYTGSINPGHTLRFKVDCKKCDSEDTCDNGNVTVKFYSPRNNNCAANCQGS